VPKVIVSNRDPKFTSNFWKGLFKGFGTNLNFSTTYHPKLNGQTGRINQVLEDILRIYVMDKPSRLEEYLHLVEWSVHSKRWMFRNLIHNFIQKILQHYLHLVEFAYNNGYKRSSKMSPFEALYGRKWNTLVS
jgi:hypothetical protein